MPRPPKHVPPDTLGGRIRAARENLHLSLANVAAKRYSTSLISQIERNRVEPSRESLQFLAEKLQLPLEDLEELARQQKESATELYPNRANEELLSKVSQLLNDKRPNEALCLLKTLNLQRTSPTMRWRLAAARGHCYFTLHQFIKAQQDFLYAVTERSAVVPVEQRLEAMALHLHLATTLRELNQPDTALEQYSVALGIMDTRTSLHFVAEAHRGMSLIAIEWFHRSLKQQENTTYRESQLQLALKHAENASILYRSIGDSLREALLTCQIGLIEQLSGKPDEARKRLLEVLSTWQPVFETHIRATAVEQGKLQEMATVIFASACLLARIELEAQNHEAALKFVQQARFAAQHADSLRLAEGEVMYGRILESQNIKDPEAEVAFRKAINTLASTEHIAAQIRAHDVLGRHL
ncbi:MAG TPA: helix-turn-helix transcriptional regulator, partial [Ktedonobacteraceae bacterium]|nr:helix-turn-helix transcriptional regulator [Ktedonobacteraceae bacterium]